jgi:hypothetical protein
MGYIGMWHLKRLVSSHVDSLTPRDVHTIVSASQWRGVIIWHSKMLVSPYRDEDRPEIHMFSSSLVCIVYIIGLGLGLLAYSFKILHSSPGPDRLIQDISKMLALLNA